MARITANYARTLLHVQHSISCSVSQQIECLWKYKDDEQKKKKVPTVQVQAQLHEIALTHTYRLPAFFVSRRLFVANLCFHVTRNRPVDFVTASFTTSYSRSSDKSFCLMIDCNWSHMHAPVHRRTCIQHICTHTRSHAPSITEQIFCCFFMSISSCLWKSFCLSIIYIYIGKKKKKTVTGHETCSYKIHWSVSRDCTSSPQCHSWELSTGSWGGLFLSVSTLDIFFFSWFIFPSYFWMLRFAQVYPPSVTGPEEFNLIFRA